MPLSRILIPPLLLVVEDFLVCSYLNLSDQPTDELENFLLLENQRCWRQFLSVSKSTDWVELRRTFLKWTLNRSASKKYLFDSAFRNNILDKMESSYRQLLLNLSGLDFLEVESVFSNDSSDIFSNIYSINLTSSRNLSKMPPVKHVHHLNLYKSIHLNDISLIEDIQDLNLQFCQQLETLEPLLTVKELDIFGISTNFLNYFNLSQLTRLSTSVLVTDDGDQLIDFSLFANVEHLTLYGDIERPEDDRTRLPAVFSFPHLKSLQLYHCHLQALQVSESFDSLELFNSSFDSSLVSSLFPQLKVLRGEGKNFLSVNFDDNSRLKSFSYAFIDTETDKHISSEFISRFTNFENLDFSMNRSLKKLEIGPKVTNLQANGSSIKHLTGFHREKHYFKLYLNQTPIEHISSAFENITAVSLNNCPSLCDVSALSQVPNLSLVNCRRIKNFSCLGGRKQRYLNLSHNQQLKNSDVAGLGDVFYLDISSCPLISDLFPLENNFYLVANDCDGIRKCHFLGKNYLLISLMNCRNIEKIKVSHPIYQLRLSGKELWVSEKLETVMVFEGRDKIEFLDVSGKF
jgi:hypothetical protein